MAISGVKEAVNTYAAGANNSGSQIAGKNQLSETAKSYMQNEVQQKIPEANITVVDFKSKEQKLNYMLGSGGLNNVAISANIVEQMAENPDIAAKYEKMISENISIGPEMARRCEEQTGCTILARGMVIDKNGKASYWAVGYHKNTGETLGTKYRKEMQTKIDEQRAEKKAEAKKAEKRAEKKAEQKTAQEKLQTTTADSPEELWQKLKDNMSAPPASLTATPAKDPQCTIDLRL